MHRLAVSEPGGLFGGRGPPGSVVVYDVSDDGELTQMGGILSGEEEGSSARGVLSGDGARLAVAEPYFVGDTIANDNMVGQVRIFELSTPFSFEGGGQTITEGICSDCFWRPLGDPIHPIDNNIGGSSKDIAVALSQNGDMLAVGAQIGSGSYIGSISWRRNLRNGSNSTLPASTGHQVQVYRYQDDYWLKFGLPMTLDNLLDKSGYSVSMSDDGLTVAIATDYVQGSQSLGKARVFRYMDGDWIQLGSNIEGEFKWQGDYFGIRASLSADGGTIAVAALGVFTSGGAAVFSYGEFDDEWYQLGGDLEGDGGEDVIDKVSLSSNGRRVAISLTWRDDSDSYVYVYELRRGSWFQVGQKITGKTDEQFGDSIALASTGNMLGVGSSAKFSDRQENVRLYALRLDDET
jgi:hypothetical protein